MNDRERARKQKRYDELSRKLLAWEAADKPYTAREDKEDAERTRLWYELNPEEQWWNEGEQEKIMPQQAWPKKRK